MKFLEFDEFPKDAVVTTSRMRVWWLVTFRGYRIWRFQEKPKIPGLWQGNTSYILVPAKVTA